MTINNRYKIAYGACLLASAYVSYSSIQDILNTESTGIPPDVNLAVFKFFLAIALVVLGLYFRYLSGKNYDKPM